jgi:hypothetical protein
MAEVREPELRITNLCINKAGRMKLAGVDKLEASRSCWPCQQAYG